VAEATRSTRSLQRVTKRIPSRALGATFCLAAWLATSTASAPRSYADEAHPSPARRCSLGAASIDTVVLVALDGVRWQEIFRGVDPELAAGARLGPAARLSAEQLVPAIHDLARRGVALGAPGHGEPFLASGPNFVSLPGYTELFSGRLAPCQENDCRAPPSWTIADGLAGLSSRPIGIFSSWEPIGAVSAADPSRLTVSAGLRAGYNLELVASDPALGPMWERASQSSPAPGHGSYRPDARTAELALGWFEQHRPSYFFLSLGDTDEYAHEGDYAGYLGALQEADRQIAKLVAIADGWATEGHRTSFVVTTDHGRSSGFRDHGRDHPESARAWLVAAGGPIPTRGFVSSRTSRRLRDVAPTLRVLLGLDEDRSSDAGSAIDELLPACSR
jgi:hypothetical protein